MTASVAALGESLGPAAGHRHNVLTVTTHNKPDGHRGQRGYFGLRGAPTSTRSRPRPGNAGPTAHNHIHRPGPLAGILLGGLETRIRSRENSARSHRKHSQEATGVSGYARGCAKLLACSDLRSPVQSAPLRGSIW